MVTRTSSERSASAVADGRRRRRELGRLAVVDALIDLLLGGVAAPTADQIAARAEVSVASVHRYFSSLDELRRVGVQRYFERIGQLMEVPAIGDGPLPRRVERLVASRLEFYDTTQTVARHARRHAADVPELAATLQRVRATLADQIAQHFEPELAGLRASARRELVAVIAALTSFEAWDQLREHGLGPAEIARAWRTHLTRLMSPTSG